MSLLPWFLKNRTLSDLAEKQKATADEIVDLRTSLQGLERQLDAISSKNKDAWDKFDLISKFVASVLLVSVGGLFTYVYNSSQQERERQISLERQQTYQLETVSKFLPYLANDKEEIRRTAILSVQVLVGTELATRLALVQVGPDTPNTLNELRQHETGKAQAFADEALKQVVATGPFSVVRTFFATTRSAVPGSPATYGVERGKVAYGSADISIPRAHTFGEVERPIFWRLEFGEDREKHLTITARQNLEKERFFTTIADHVQATSSKDVIVYVHGYNVTFDDAAKRAAQISYDLGIKGPCLLFSWPSRASATGYLADIANAESSAADLTEFLSNLTTTFAGTNVHLIAHSLGAHVLSSWLDNQVAAGSKRVFPS